MAGITPLQGRVARVLSEAELDAIHETTLRTLSEVGIGFEDEEALTIFRRCPDAQVEGSLVRLQPRLVEQAIEQAPARFPLRARNPKYDLWLGEGKVYYSSGFGATFVCDSEHQVYREATLQDVRDYLTLADALENVHYQLMPFVPQDMPPEYAELYTLALQFNHTEKHIGVSTPHSRYLEEILSIGQRVADDSGVEGPVFSWGCVSNSPLGYSRESLPKMIRGARAGIPFLLVSGAISGTTAPVTLAGTLVVQNAEILAGNVLCQLVNPGTPIVYGTFAGGMDMRTGKWASAGPEMSLINAATAQLCQRYQIPLGYGTGGIADSRIPDVRAGIEKALTTLFAAMCGVEMIHDGVSGLMGGAMAQCFEQLVIDNEMAHLVNRLMQGIRVDEDTLAFDLIKEVGPGGHFLDQPHTAKRFKQEHLLSKLFSREYGLVWPESETETLLVQAREKAKQILASHRPAPLPRETQIYIEAVLEGITGTARKLF